MMWQSPRSQSYSILLMKQCILYHPSFPFIKRYYTHTAKGRSVIKGLARIMWGVRVILSGFFLSSLADFYTVN